MDNEKQGGCEENKCKFVGVQNLQKVCARFPPTPQLIPSQNMAGENIMTIHGILPPVLIEIVCGEYKSSKLLTPT